MPFQVNALSILALKVKKNTFDLSTGQRHISLRDQIIRARLLVRDLVNGGQISPRAETLIVGAGAAGISAALSLAEKGRRCHVLESHPEPFSLQKSASTRFVGPYLYEWPSAVYSDQTFPPTGPSPLSSLVTATTTGGGLTFPSTGPMSAKDLAAHWIGLLKSSRHLGREIRVHVDVPSKPVKAEIQRWVRDRRVAMSFVGRDWPATAHASNFSVRPRFVFLAGGFGPEKVELISPHGNSIAKSIPFWQDDKLLDSKAGWSGSGPAELAVVGGGDGALQDVLRALTGETTPLRVLEAIAAASSIARQKIESVWPVLAARERNNEFGGPWEVANFSTSADQVLHNAMATLASGLAADREVQRAVGSTFRPAAEVNTVHLIVNKPYFGKSFALNRFLVLLSAEVSRPIEGSGKARLQLHLGVEIVRRISPRYPTDMVLSNGQSLKNITECIPRFGPDSAKATGQMIGISAMDTVNRRELSEIRLPLWIGD